MRKINDNLVIVLLAGGVGNRLRKQTSKQLINYDNETILEKNIIIRLSVFTFITRRG